MANDYSVVTRTRSDSILETNSVIRNTYILLGASLLFSAAMAAVAMVTHAPSLGLVTLVGYFGLLFLVNATRNSAFGILSVFALTGFMGYTLGPLLNMYLAAFTNGHQLIFTALAGTGITFFALSGYALVTRKDFSYLAGFMLAASVVLLLAMVVQIFFPMPMMMVMTSAGFVLFSSAAILFETSQIINGGQRNYIMATVSIFVSLYNLFVSLLNILSFFGGNRE